MNDLLQEIADGKSVLHFGKSETVFSEGEKADAIYFVQTGKIKVAVVSPAGREAVLSLAGPRDFFGEECLTAQPVRADTASALEPTTVCRIEKEAMRRALREMPSLSVKFTAALWLRNMRLKEDLCDQFFNVEVDNSLRVTGFEEKPANPRPLPTNPFMALVSMGVYVFKKSVLLTSLRAVCESGIGYDFGHHIIPALIHSARSYAYDFRDEKENTSAYWRDIGTIDAYYAASMDLIQDNPPFDPSPLRHPTPRHRLCARVHSDSRIAQSVLSPSVRIEGGADIDGAILLPGVRVGEGA